MYTENPTQLWIFIFPTPALSGSGNLGMISARLLGHPLSNERAKINCFVQKNISSLIFNSRGSF